MSKENDQAFIVAKQKIVDAYNALAEASKALGRIEGNTPSHNGMLYRNHQTLLAVTNIVWQVRNGIDA